MIEFFQDGERTDTVEFPNDVPVGTTAEVEVEISNPKNFPVEVEVIENPDDDYILKNVPERLPAKSPDKPARRFTITIEFTPSEGRPPFEPEQLFKVIW